MVLHIARQLQIVCLNWISNEDITLFPCFFLGFGLGNLLHLIYFFSLNNKAASIILNIVLTAITAALQNELNLKNVDWISTTLHALC